MGKHVAGQMRSLSFYRDTLVIHEDEKSCNQQRLRLFFLRVQVPGNTLTPCIFSVTFDSKTGGLRWIFMDRGRNSIGLWSGWKTSAILLVTLPPLNSLSCRKRHLLSTKSETKN